MQKVNSVQSSFTLSCKGGSHGELTCGRRFRTCSADRSASSVAVTFTRRTSLLVTNRVMSSSTTEEIANECDPREPFLQWFWASKSGWHVKSKHHEKQSSYLRTSEHNVAIGQRLHTPVEGTYGIFRWPLAAKPSPPTPCFFFASSFYIIQNDRSSRTAKKKKKLPLHCLSPPLESPPRGQAMDMFIFVVKLIGLNAIKLPKSTTKIFGAGRDRSAARGHVHEHFFQKI